MSGDERIVLVWQIMLEGIHVGFTGGTEDLGSLSEQTLDRQESTCLFNTSS